MSLTIRITPETEADIQQAYHWYEARSQGLGNAFVDEIDSSLERIERNPQSYATVHEDVRRALLNRFPYGIFYAVSDDEIVVFACFHCSRDPDTWCRRI